MMLDLIKEFFGIHPKQEDDSAAWSEMIVAPGATLTIEGDVRTTRITCMEGATLLVNGTLDLRHAGPAEREGL